MSNILNISSKNSYLTSKQWEDVKKYVKNRINTTEGSVIKDSMENQVEVTEKLEISEEPIEIQHSEAYERMIQTLSVEEMYVVLLRIMNEELEKLYEMTSDEIQILYNTAANMNENNPSDDYADLADTLQYLAGDYDLNGAEVLIPDGYTEFTIPANGYLYSGSYCLTSDIVLERPLIIPYGNTVYLDLNGFVLSSSAVNNLKGITYYDDSHKNLWFRVIHLYGDLIINDSNPSKENRGSLEPVSRWVDKRLDASKFTPEGTVYEATNTYTDRYYWDTTSIDEFWVYDKTGSEIIKGGIITGGVHSSGGGAFYISGGNLTINGGTIAGNKSIRYVITAEDTGYQTAYTGNGGAIYATESGTFGSPEYRVSTITMNGGSIKYNWTDYLGGGVALTNYTKFYMNSGNISENTAQSSGGALTVRTNSSFYLGDENKTYTNDNIPTIESNQTLSTRYHGGGGGLEVDGGYLEYKIGKIIYNKASGFGGGIYCYRGGSINAKTANSIISNNSATSGGGIYLQYGDVILDNCILENNSALDFGGAVGLRVGNFSIVGGRIYNNYAGNFGGAIYTSAQNNYSTYGDTGLLGCSVSIKGTLVDSNKAGNSGGAIYASVMNSLSDVTVNIISSTITNNKSGEATNEGLGGAIYLSGGILTIDEDSDYGDMIVTGNIANGGGAFYIEDTVRTKNDSLPPYTVTNPPDGAELDSTGSYYDKEITIDNITTYDNSKVGKMIINKGKFLNNQAILSYGGVAYIAGKISDSNDYNVEINNGSFTNNSAIMYGGSIYVINGNFIMNNGTFDNNTAEVSGGAIYVADGNVDIESGMVSNNIALENGGAITVTSGNVTIGTQECYDAGESSTHNHPIIESNIASNGGGIYVDGGTTIMWCGNIKHNHTYDKTVNIDVNGGNFIYNGGTIGIPYDSGVFINGGLFNDNSDASGEPIKHELWYHSVLKDMIYNNKIPESKWIASPRGNILHLDDCDDTTPTWEELLPEYEFVGWENKTENDTDKVVNLYAIWENTNS